MKAMSTKKKKKILTMVRVALVFKILKVILTKKKFITFMLGIIMLKYREVPFIVKYLIMKS
jgi:uncharacterized membrane protein